MAWLDPTTREKFQRFRKQRRAWISFWLLALIFVVSLFSELIAHGTPWRVRFEGRNYFPRWQTVTQDVFLGDGVRTQPDFRALAREDIFADSADNRMWWAPVPFGPHNTMSADDIELDGELLVRRRRVQRVGSVRVSGDLQLIDGNGAAWFFGVGSDAELRGLELPEFVAGHLQKRFANEPADALNLPDESGRFTWSLSSHEPRTRPPRTVRITLRENFTAMDAVEDRFTVAEGEEPSFPRWWGEMPDAIQTEAEEALEEARIVPVRPIRYEEPGGYAWQLSLELETVQFPFRPVKGHPLGLDESGRDVLVLILYATRISLLFGFILVICSMVLGTLLGALQGYFGGWLDLVSQRLIEIYQSIPFLYVMIFLGSVFGRSFWLLLFVYAMFNWIGISYYMRAEFLRLRRQPFTEAARALGLPTRRIMWRHLLPNAMVPLITFFPFMLVGAIGSLSSLDYLGFGLPAGVPSWGVLLRQAQTARHAWWLVTYSSLALFVVILLSVFIGEGLRAAFDPKREAHWEA